MIREDIIKSAKIALRDLNTKSLEGPVDIIDNITKMSQLELSQLLNKVKIENEIKESRILFFDTLEKAKEIATYSIKAKYAIVHRDYPTVRGFLKHIINLENLEIKNIKNINTILKGKNSELYNRIALESSFILFTRNRIQPFAADIGKTLDIFFNLKSSLEKKIDLLIQKQQYPKIDIRPLIFEREQQLILNDSLANELNHPTIILHQAKRTFEEIFKGYVFISTLGVMSYHYLTNNVFDIVKKLKIKNNIQKTYSQIAFDFDSDYDMLVITYKNTYKSIERLNKKLDFLHNKLAVIKSKKAAKDLLEEYLKFISSAEKKITRLLDKFELENQEVHDSITKYIIRKREKQQENLKNAKIK